MAIKISSILVFILFSGFISAQESAVEEVVVFGIRASMDDLYEVPSVTIRKNADFLIQAIRLVNDSRSPELRKSEIINTIKNLIKTSSKVKGIEISYGEDFLEPIKLDDESLELLEERGKSDTSFINIYIKVAFSSKKPAKSQISSLRSFIASAKLDGRTLIEPEGDIGLSIVNPQQYRYEILQAISLENRKTREIIGENCEVSIKGLERRVVWERVSVGEVMLYISYVTTVKCE